MKQPSAQCIALQASDHYAAVKSNYRSEANPTDLLEWTDGEALIATGSRFLTHLTIMNTILLSAIMPSSTLALVWGSWLVSTRADDGMMAACRALGQLAPATRQPHGGLLPSFSAVSKVSRIAIAVAEQAILTVLLKLKQMTGPKPLNSVLASRIC